MTEETKLVELDEDFIAIAIPANTVELELSAKVWHNGKVVTISRTLPFEEVKEAFKEANEGYIPSNAVYCVLTGNPYALSANYLSFIRTA